MRLNNSRKELIERIIKTVEESFKGSIVLWKCTGTPSDDYTDDTEVFEAYMIGEPDYDKLVNLKWKLRREIARPNGFTIQIHEFTPSETMEYRKNEYCENRQIRETVKLKEEHKRIQEMLERHVMANNFPVAASIAPDSLYSDTTLLHSAEIQSSRTGQPSFTSWPGNTSMHWLSRKLEPVEIDYSVQNGSGADFHNIGSDEPRYQPDDTDHCSPNGEAEHYAVAA